VIESEILKRQIAELSWNGGNDLHIFASFLYSWLQFVVSHSFSCHWLVYLLPSLSLIFFMFYLLCTPPFSLECRLSILSRIYLNGAPCRGFVKNSASMFSVGEYATLTYPFLILSVTKMYLMLRWRVRLLIDNLQFSDSNIMHLLSWYMVVVGMGFPLMFSKCAFCTFFDWVWWLALIPFSLLATYMLFPP